MTYGVCLTHSDPLAQAALEQYLSVLGSGGSALVRPVAAYDGLEMVCQHVAALAGGPLLVTSMGGADPTKERPATGRGTDAVVAFHTSGSTGRPKCVVYDAATVRAHAAMIGRSLSLDRECRYAALTPCGFAYGLSIVHSHALTGVPVHFVVGGTAGLGEGLQDRRDVDTVYLLPQQATLLLGHADDLPSLRTIIVAGGRLAAATASALGERFPGLELVNMYGQAELGPRISTWRGPIADFSEGLIGQPVEGVEIELGPPDDRGRGELRVRTPYGMRHLLRAPYDDVVPGPAPDASHATGDYAVRVEAGFVHAGRADGFANVAGTRVDLDELTRTIERAVPTVAVRVRTRTSRVTGDDLVVVQVVPPGGTEHAAYDAVGLRRALHPVVGSLVSLLDIRLVDHLAVGEAGK